MTLIKFLNNPECSHAGKYAWRLAMTPEGVGLYAYPDADHELMLMASAIPVVTGRGGHVTVDGKILALGGSAFKWAEDNFPGSFTENTWHEDTNLTMRLNDMSVLTALNNNRDEHDELSGNLGYSVACIIMTLSPESAAGNPAIRWLLADRHDDTCDALAAADAYTPKPAGNATGCSCSTVTEPVTSQCSALDIYRNYMDGMTIDTFGDLGFLDSVFTYTLNGQTFRNDELIERLIAYIGRWSAPQQEDYGFGCPSDYNADKDIDAVLSNAAKALAYIGTPDECRYKKFISYWCGKLGELCVKY